MALVSKYLRRGVVPQQQRSGLVAMSAPVGGINTTSGIADMPPTDCVYLYNMIPFQNGLRVRSGYREWATNVGPAHTQPGLYVDGSPITFGLAGVVGGPYTNAWVSGNPVGVRSVLVFSGSNTDGTGDRIWGVTDEGIWDATIRGDSPTNVFPFSYVGLPDGPTNAGRGIGTSFVNQGGDHYYAYCDGYHGYHLYSEKTQSWGAMKGISAAEGAAKAAANTLDGTEIYCANQAWEDIYGKIRPQDFRFVTWWKNRLWFCVEGSSLAWYLDVGNFAGPANPMPFAPRFHAGGELVGLWSWTVDGGIGVDDYLVGISRGGDVVIYSGTDPALPGAFALRGVWWVGRPPPGRSIASNFGGDLFILSVVGCVPLSKLVSGAVISTPTLMASAKVANLFNKYMTERGEMPGWSLAIHPTDNLIMVNVPPKPGEVGEQFVMSLANMGWAQQVGVPIQCMATWRNKLYFGTSDGRICVNDGVVDDLNLTGTSLKPINWALLTSYQRLGTANRKRVHIVRARFLTDETRPGVTTQARFDFDTSPITLNPSIPVATPTAWDVATWDESTWAGGTPMYQHMSGGAGYGANVAVALAGSSVTSTTLAAFEIVAEPGGVM